MAFWGVEVEPGIPYTHQHDVAGGRLRVSLATLGYGEEAVRSVLLCSVGSRSPVLLCSLIPDQSETCHLNLEFEEYGDVDFSVIGPRSVHLSGFFLNQRGRGAIDDEGDSFGEDIGVEDSMDSNGNDEDAYEPDFIDDRAVDIFPHNCHFHMIQTSTLPKNGVVIEEIVEDDEPKIGPRNIIVKINSSHLIESEDEDGFPITSSSKRKNVISNANEKTSNESKMEDDCREGKEKNKSNHDEFAGEDNQLHNSSLLCIDGTENSGISRKKKKVQDLNSPESLPKAWSVEITSSNQDNDADDNADLTKEHDAKLKKKKKKKEKAKKSKTSGMGIDNSNRHSDDNPTLKEAKKKKKSKKPDKDSNRKRESLNLMVEDKEELEPKVLADGLTIDGKKAVVK